MKKLLLSAFLFYVATSSLLAQDEEPREEKKGFKKENLFTGGSISFGFGSAYGSSSFSIGASPVFGYNITNWLDAGIAVNYNYQSIRGYYVDGDKLKQNQYGGGTFVKIYPVRFLYAQAQVEHNFVDFKYNPGNGSGKSTQTFQTNSVLVGAGYAGRDPIEKRVFFYLSILFDVSGVRNTPYTNAAGNAVPIITGGIQIPLFQGKSRNNYYEEPQNGGGGGGKRPRNYNRY